MFSVNSSLPIYVYFQFNFYMEACVVHISVLKIGKYVPLLILVVY